MPHIHRGAGEHDLTVTAYIVRLDDDEPRILLHMHKKLGILLPVGGHVELNETPWQAIAHEIKEECGYGITQLQVLQPKLRIKQLTGVVLHPQPISINTHDIPSDHFHTDLRYGFITDEDPSFTVDTDESIDLRWLTSRELDELQNDEIFPNTREVYRFVLDEALSNWERLPAIDFQLDFPEDYLKYPE